MKRILVILSVVCGILAVTVPAQAATKPVTITAVAQSCVFGDDYSTYMDTYVTVSIKSTTTRTVELWERDETGSWDQGTVQLYAGKTVTASFWLSLSAQQFAVLVKTPSGSTLASRGDIVDTRPCYYPRW